MFGTILANRELELVGCYAWSLDKVGSDVGELVRILEAGVDVVATAAFITGHALGGDRQRVIDA